jgi:hypothetical protein
MFSSLKEVAALGILSTALSFGTVGCATARGTTAGEALGITTAQGSADSLRAGSARVIGAHINPLASVQAVAEGGQISVRFMHPRTQGGQVDLDPESLSPVSPEQPVPAAAATAPIAGPTRIALPGGRFIVCWKSGSTEWGYHLMAQLWTASGSPLGDPVVVSPDAEVIGAPQLVAVDGERVVAIFSAGSEAGFKLLAVPLDAPSSRSLSASREK